MNYRLTRAAERDVRDILSDTVKTFGTRQLEAYAAIIDKGIAMIADAPERPGSLARPEIGPGVRLFHLELAAGRSGGAAHCLYYMVGPTPEGGGETIVLRVLHEHMEPRHRVIRSVTEKP